MIRLDFGSIHKNHKLKQRKKIVFAASALCLCCGLAARFFFCNFQSTEPANQYTWVFDEHCSPTFASVVTQTFQASIESSLPTVAEFVKSLEFVQLSFPCITSCNLTTRPDAYHIHVHCKKPQCIINDKCVTHDGCVYPRTYFTDLDCPSFQINSTCDAQAGLADRLSALPSVLLHNYSVLSVDKHALCLRSKNRNRNYTLAVRDVDVRASSKLALANFVGSYMADQQESDVKWVVDTRFDKSFYVREVDNLKGGTE